MTNELDDGDPRITGTKLSKVKSAAKSEDSHSMYVVASIELRGHATKSLILSMNDATLIWRQIGEKIDHYISCRWNFLIPWKIALRVVVFHSSCSSFRRNLD